MVTAVVRDGVVTLAGEVTWQVQRTAAERAVQYQRGVVAVRNKIVTAGAGARSCAGVGAPAGGIIVVWTRCSAYRKAQKELDGLIVLPASIRAQIEHRIAGQLEA